MTESTKSMTAEEAMRERIEELERQAGVVGINVELTTLKWVLSLLKTDRMALVTKIGDALAQLEDGKIEDYKQFDADYLYGQADTDQVIFNLKQLKDELESKSDVK